MKSTLICSQGQGTGNELRCVQSKNFEDSKFKEAKHFFDDAWTDTKREAYGTKDENYKKKETLKIANKEVVDGYSEEHKKDKGVSADGQVGDPEKEHLTEDHPTVSAEASNPGASVEEHPVGVGHVASFQQVQRNIKIKIQ